MNQIDDAYSEAQLVKSIAEKYEQDAEYWQMVHGLLLEESYLHSDAEVKREEKRIVRQIKRNAKMARRVNRIYNRLMRKYEQKWGNGRH